jgi:hypothetical protein
MEGMLTSIVVVAAGVFVIVRICMRSRAAVIKSPRIGFLDFSGGELAGQLLEDKAAFGSLFESNPESISTPPQCDVLLLYCRIGPEGTIEGSHHGLRELIRDSGAVVVVIASENTGPQYVAAMKKTGYGNANLVMTFNRKGPVFGQFFYKLFGLMKKGKSMPMAWVRLVPQSHGREQPNCPDALFVCEAGPISFR